MASLEFKNITKRFENGAVALRNFNLNIEAGELVVLVGGSGCGKSTALRLLAGLEMPSEGEILINDKVVNLDTPQQRNVAMVFQNYALYPHMTVRDNLAFPLKMSHTPAEKIVSRVAEIAELLELSKLLERKPAQLSGGQRQRVAMGRALVRDPSVFLLDEPLSNLDAKLRAQIRADIARIQKRLNKTTLYVTHDQVEAMTLGDRVAVLEAGEVQQIGTPEQLYNHPNNIFVAKFIGNPGMNIVPSRFTVNNKQQIAIQLGTEKITVTSLDKSMFELLAQHADQPVFTGFRPESLVVESFEKALSIRLQVKSVEYLGHESLVYFEFATNEGERKANELIARLPGRITTKAGDTIDIYVSPDDFSFFDKEGQNIAGAE